MDRLILAEKLESLRRCVRRVEERRAGDAVPDQEIASIRSGTRLPLIARSGVTADNAPHVLAQTDGTIIGPRLKRDGVWWNEVEVERVRALVRVVLRDATAGPQS